MHLVTEDIVKRFLASKKIKRQRVVLASKPHDVYFLCLIPGEKLDNLWNATSLVGCEKAKVKWVQVSSRKAEGSESYQTKFTVDADAFPEPKWPRHPLDAWIEATFKDSFIEDDDSIALSRLIGRKLDLK